MTWTDFRVLFCWPIAAIYNISQKTKWSYTVYQACIMLTFLFGSLLFGFDVFTTLFILYGIVSFTFLHDDEVFVRCIKTNK